MPTYEYECKTCGYRFETVQAMHEDPLTICPKCGKEIRRLIFGGSGVIFKGSGFYVTDSKSSNACNSHSTHAESESKPCSTCPQKETSQNSDTSTSKKTVATAS